MSQPITSTVIGSATVGVMKNGDATIAADMSWVGIPKKHRKAVALALAGTTPERLNQLLSDLVEAAAERGVRSERGSRNEVEYAQADIDTALAEIRSIFGIKQP